MLYQTYDFLWAPQRPPRSHEEVEGALKALTPESIAERFTFEDRVAIRSLIYCVMDDASLRDMLDGVMLPPPYAMLDIAGYRWTAKDIAAIVRVLPPALDGLIVHIPFHLALRLGSYDARLRAASRRLCWVLNIPFTVVEEQEEAVAQARLAMVEAGVLAGASAQGQQGAIVARKEEQKRSLKRIATVGGFAVLGGAALVLTGGLVAPAVGPAFAALAAGATATVGAIGAAGGAVLGGGALSAAFAAVVGVGTHAAALASVLTPVLTAGNVTAIFGVSGASLAGYKALRRTGNSDTCVLRSIDEVETFAGLASPEGGAPEDAATVATLAASNQAVEKEQAGILGTTLDLSSVVEDGCKPGLVVPAHTRTVALRNVGAMSMIRKRGRRVVFGLDSALTGYELRLKAVKLNSGVWGMAPPNVIAAGCAGVCACMNRYMHPTGTGFVLCYVAVPVATRGASPSVRLWVRVDYDFLGVWEVSSFCESIDRELDPFKAEMHLETCSTDGDYTKTQIGLTMEMHLRPFTYLKVYASADKLEHARKVTFPAEELPQRRVEYAHSVKQRRKIGVSFVNQSRHVVHVVDSRILNGVQWPGTPSPMVVESRTASLTYFTNAQWSMEGAEAYYIIEVVNRNESPLVPRYYVRVQFEISALNKLNVAVAAAPTVAELRQMELTPETPPSAAYPVVTRPGLFFGLTLRPAAKECLLAVHVEPAVEREASVRVAQRAALTIGVCGYSGVFDVRRPMQDQQVGLWQPVLRTSALLGPGESYTLQWEDEYLVKYGETVKTDLQVADQVGQKAMSKAKSIAKKELMQGAIFSGFRAFNAFLGAVELPLYAVWASDVIDNNYATLSNRAVYAGNDLAAALLDPVRGSRPVSLVGFSFGSKVIAECLKELLRVKAFGIVENVYLLGSIVTAQAEEWVALRRIVAGRLVNVYTRSDWALWLMYKANEGDLKPLAGLAPVSVPGVENVDASAIVQSQSGYARYLADVLALIPPAPTPDTWSRKTLRGSPGVVAPSSRAKTIVKTMGSSLNSMLASTPFCAFAVCNSVVTDVPSFAPTLELVAVSTFGCFFDFLPPPAVVAGCAGVFGAVGEATEEPVGGVVSFRLRLDPISGRDLLLLLTFYVERNDDVYATVRPSMVTRRATREESTADADARLYTIATQAVTGLEDAKAATKDVGPAPSVVTPRAGTAALTFELPVEGVFLDGHRHALMKLTLRKVPGGLSMDVLALLNRATSQLQQEAFNDEVYRRQFAKKAEAAAQAALGLGTGNESSEGKASASVGRAAASVGLRRRSGAHVSAIAEVESLDYMQSTLLGIAAEAGAAAGDAEGSALPTDEAYIVLANCGDCPLYVGEAESARGGRSRCGAVGTVREGDDEDSGGVASSWQRRPCVQWVRYPPPELGPHSFAVVSVADLTHSGFPRLRYETADGVCAFDITATEPVSVTPSSSFAGPSTDAPSTEASRLIVCSVVAPLQPPRCGPSTSEEVGEVSTSTTTVRGLLFSLVLMTPRTCGGGRSFGCTEADNAKVQSVLKSYGWFVA